MTTVPPRGEEENACTWAKWKTKMSQIGSFETRTVLGKKGDIMTTLNRIPDAGRGEMETDWEANRDR